MQRAKYVIGLTKAFDLLDHLISRHVLFKIFTKIECPPKFKSLIESFHNNMCGTVQYKGNKSELFKIYNSAKQGCILASQKLFEIFFLLLLKHAIDTVKKVYTCIHKPTSNCSTLLVWKERQKNYNNRHAVCMQCCSSSTQPITPSIFDGFFANACTDVVLYISLKKQVLAQATTSPNITINNYQLKVVDKFT